MVVVLKSKKRRAVTHDAFEGAGISWILRIILTVALLEGGDVFVIYVI